MTKEVEERLDKYAEMIVQSKPEPPTPEERAAGKAFIDILEGKPTDMDEAEVYRILDEYRAKPNMTHQQWLDLEKEVCQFLKEEVDLTDPMYLPFAHEMGVLHRICDGIRIMQEEEEEMSSP